MINGFVDTNILIEIYRGIPSAKSWYSSQPDLGLSSVTWLELFEGAGSKVVQNRCLEIVAALEIVFVTETDQRWAMAQMLTYRFSYGLKLKGCLIASVCHRLQVPIYTQNVKDFVPILGQSLAIKPY